MYKLLLTLFLWGVISKSNGQNIVVDTVSAKRYVEKADEYFNKKDSDSAMIFLEKAGKLYEKHRQWEKYIEIKVSQTNLYQQKWKIGKAISVLKEVNEKALPKIKQNSKTVYNTYFLFGNLYQNKDKKDSAIYYWKKSLEIIQKTHKEQDGEVFKATEIYDNMVVLYKDMSKYDEALKYAKKSMDIKRKLFKEVSVEIATSYNNEGLVYWKKAEYDKAISLFQKCLEILKKLLGEEHIYIAITYNNIGLVYEQKSEYETAIKYHLKSLNLKKKIIGKDDLNIALSYNNIGLIYYHKANYDKALEYFFRSLKIKKNIQKDENENIAISYNNIGLVFFKKVEYAKALDYFFKSLKIREEQVNGNKQNIARTYNNIGNIYHAKQKYDNAINFYKKSLNIYETIYKKEHSDIAQVCSNLGSCYVFKEQYDLALKYLLKSLKISKEIFGVDNDWSREAYYILGNLYTKKEEYNEAIENILKGYSIAKKIYDKKHKHLALGALNIGETYLLKKEYTTALKYYQKSIVDNVANFGDTTNLYTVPIINNYTSGEELLKALIAKINLLLMNDIGGNKESNLKTILQHVKAADTLIVQIRNRVTLKSDKISLAKKANEVYTNAVNVCLKLSDLETLNEKYSSYKELAFQFSEKNKSAVFSFSLAHANALQFAGLPDSLIKKEKNIQINIAFYKQKLAERLDSAKKILFQDKLFEYNRKYEILVEKFENNYPDYFTIKYNNKTVSISELQKTLDKKTSLISYLNSDSIIYVFVISRKKYEVFSVEKPRNFERMIQVFRRSIISKQDKIYSNFAYKLHEILFPKNAIYKKTKNLIIIPDGVLTTIPFEALLTEKLDSYLDLKSKYPFLIKKYNISYSYSANLWYNSFIKQNKKTELEEADKYDLLSFAPVFTDKKISGVNLRTRSIFNEIDSIFYMNDSIKTRGRMLNGEYITSLPATEKEVNQIFKIFEKKGKKAIVKTHSFANESIFKTDTLSKGKIIHIATHGFVNSEKPELSGILLSQSTDTLASSEGVGQSEDGILYSGEIYNLKLNADLVVLSACETGLGKIYKGEGVIGLTRALMYAGAKNLIVSLWKVSDESTGLLMIDFYKQMLKNKKSFRNSDFKKQLRKAKLKMIKTEKYSHPYFWSAFVLIGK